MPFRQHIRSTTDTAVTAVYYEDSAALLGNAIALAGLGMHQLLGSPAPDAVAGIVIGLLLAAIGLRLAGRNRALLTNRSDSPIVLDCIRDLLAADPEVAAVGHVASVYVGPRQLLVTAEIQPMDAICGLRLRQLLAELRGRVADAIPRAATVFLTPVVAVEPEPELTPWDRDYWLRRFRTTNRLDPRVRASGLSGNCWSQLAVRLLFGDGCEVRGDRLVQLLAGGGDPCVDTGLMRDVKCAFCVVETAGRGMYPVAAADAWCAGRGGDHGGTPTRSGRTGAGAVVRRQARLRLPCSALRVGGTGCVRWLRVGPRCRGRTCRVR